MAALPEITAVVVSCDGGARTLRTLEALAKQATPPVAIILVDNGSSDGTPASVRERFPQVDVVELGVNRGLPAARNEGLRRATTPLVLLLDHDVYLGAECLARLAAHFTAGGDRAVAVVCPRIRLVPERDTVQADGAEAHFLGTMTLRHGFRPLGELPVTSTDVGACVGACMLVRRDPVVQAGGFDELFFFYLEDHEFSLRMRGLGYRIVCDPAAEVFHERGAGTPGLSYRGAGSYPARRTYLTLRHRLLAMLVHYRARTLLLLAPALAGAELMSLAATLRRGHGIQWLRAWGWIATHWGQIADRRLRVQLGRVVGDGALLTGGPIPLAPGSIGASWTRLARLVSAGFDGYWRLVRRWVA